MELTLTMFEPETTRGRDAVVDLAQVTTAADLSAALGALRGRPVARMSTPRGTIAPDALVGSMPLLHGAEILLDTLPLPPDADSVIRIHVAGGPDAGEVRALRGTCLVGRGAGCDLRVEDPAMSRAHMSITLERTGIRVTDVGSTNGTNGSAELRSGHVLTVGTSRLRLAPPLGPPLPQRPTGDGRIEVDPPYRQRPAITPATLDLPPAPSPPSPPRIPWAAALMSIPLAAVLAFVVGPQLLWLAIMGPVLAVGSAAAERVLARRRHRQAVADDDLAMARVHDRLEELKGSQAAVLDAGTPDPAQVIECAIRRTAPLWGTPALGAGFATVRLGWGQPRARIAVRQPSPARPAGTSPAQPVRHHDAPVVVNLAELGVLVVRGEPTRVRRVIDGLVGQLAVLHRPADLLLDVLDGPSSPWRWLPHAGTWNDAQESLAERLDARRRAWTRSTDVSGSQVIVVPNLPDDTDLSGLIADARAAGVVVLLGVHGSPTPVDVAVLDVGSRGGILVHGDETTQLEPDHVGPAWVHRLTRALAPLIDPECRALTAHATAPDAAGPAVNWPVARRGADTALAAVGVRNGQPWEIDLDRDGPHLLVGGTTGSGKSEFLRTLVGALAARLPPEDLSLVLIDYKGGASFGACADLPHTAGVLTDLGPGLAARALHALRAEVTRRERLLAAHGASDRAAYLSTVENAADRAQLTRLVIVVDEFRALAQDQPDVLSGIIHLAAVGRSLGVHLVLATQRPGGVVGPDIRANVNLRIALRVRDRHDSIDVIESPEAATLPTEPGHALARTGDGELVPFRVLPLGVRRPLAQPAVRWADAAQRPDEGAAAGPTRLDDLVAQIRAQDARRGSLRPPAVWLPPLPERLEAQALTDPAAFALSDLPEQQRQEPVTWRPGDGHLLVAGGPRSGRTTTLRSLIEAVTHAALPDHVHIHVIATDPGRLADSATPHLGTLVGPDSRQARGLLERLRREALAGSLGQPHTVLVIDDLDAIDGPDRLAPNGLGELVSHLAGIDPHRLSIVASGGRAAATGTFGRGAHHLLVLPFDDLADRALMGVRAADIPVPWPPGRVLRQGRDESWVQAQVAVPGSRAPRPGQRCAFVLSTLPDVVSADGLESPPSGWTLALRNDPRELLSWLPERDGRRILVVGRAGSGRTTALSRLAHAESGLDRAVAWVAGKSVGPRIGLPHRVTVVMPDEPAALMTLRRDHPDVLVLVDDAELIRDTAVEPALLEIARLADRDGGAIAIAVDPSAPPQVRGLIPAVASYRSGLVLGPADRFDGELLGQRRLEPLDGPPGRGYAVVRGHVVEVHVVLDPAPAPVLAVAG